MGDILQKSWLVRLKTVKVMRNQESLRHCLEQKRLKRYANYCVLDIILEKKNLIEGKNSEIWGVLGGGGQKQSEVWLIVKQKCWFLGLPSWW